MINKIKNTINENRLLVVVLLLFFVLNVLVIYNTFSEKTTSSVWDGKIATSFSKGDGSITNPYIIDDGGKLAYFFTLINSEDNSEYFNKFYSLTNNIDLNGYDFSFATFNKTFSGNFNGNGFSIFNFTLNNYYLDEEGKTAYISLFDSLYSSNIHNLNIKDISFNVDEDKILIKNDVEKSINDSNNEINTETLETSNEENSDSNSNDSTIENKNESTSESNTENDSNNTNNSNNIEKNDDSSNNNETINETDSNNTNENLNNYDKTTNESTDETNLNETETNESSDTTNTEDEVVENLIEKIEISLFRNVNQSKIENISINNIKINYVGKEENVRSSLFILNDVGNNIITNINIVGDSNLNGTNILINDYIDATIKNIMYSNEKLFLINNYEEENDTIFRYKIENEKLSFYDNYTINSILELFNNNSELNWKFENNEFRIQNNDSNGKGNVKKVIKKINRSIPTAHQSGTEGSIVYVNDYESDANYYEGLNYTYSSNYRIPTTEKKNVYIDSNLVFVELDYHGSDIDNTYTGYVSNDEAYNQYNYYKIYKVDDNGTSSDKSDDYVLIDLIDNPFSKRPNNRTFNGWITNYEDAVISLNTDIYVRQIKIPVTYNGDNPNNIQADIYAVWNEGAITTYDGSYYYSSWSDSFSDLETEGFHQISSVDTEYESVTPYYVRNTIRRYYNYPNNSYDVYGEPLYGDYCNTQGGCYYYTHATGTYNRNTTYYKLDGTMQVYHIQQYTVYNSEVPVGNSIAGYYREVTIPSGTSRVGYFDSNGNSYQSGECTSYGGCSYYELIPYYDNNGNRENVIQNTIYYYLTTRDTNIIVMTGDVTGTWGSGQNKPFTLTGLNGNTDYSQNNSWNVRNAYIQIYADTRIEHLTVYGADYINGDTSPSVRSNNYSTSPQTSGIFGNYYNLKIGRGIKQDTEDVTTFTYVAGGNNTNTGGSRSNLTKYTLIVESGFYNNLSLTSVSYTRYTRTFYVDVVGTFGNDLDRVKKNNDNMLVRYCLSGSWSGNVYGESVTKPMLHTIVKSGQYGENKYDYAAGIYVGGRGSGGHYSAREILVEGGYIYNLIGGPLSQESNKEYNDSYIYVKGGEVDVIIGGAGRSTTYGNRIIQVTDGMINYAVFGGSNGIEGNDSDYNSTVDGDSYVYIGGNAVIGNPTYVEENRTETNSEVEAGSVFGIGNGKSGYSSIGTVNNSNVIIDGNATINRNVYGGGNYGATGQNGSNKTYQTNIIIHDGEIKGSVYGGGNNNGAGSTSNTTNINITMDGGEVLGSVYGGSRSKGRIYGSTDVKILKGKVYSDVYGGGEGGYISNTDYGTYVGNNVSVTIGNASSGPTINGTVYGGSAYGSVNTTANNQPHNNKTVNVTVNNGTILNSVFGGAKGSSSYTPQVCGDITVDINGGTISKVFGGCDEAGKPAGTATVYIDGGTVTEVYGGGNKTSLDNTNVYLRGGTATTIYGGSNQLGDVINTNLSVSGGITSTIYGGNNEGGTCKNTNITIDGGTINSAIYGGGNLVDTTSTKINIYNIENTVPSVYGGGNKAGATSTEINLNSRANNNNINITTVYGGSNESGDVDNSKITIDKGTIGSVYGGNNAGGKTSTTNITQNAGTITTIFGGGNEADSTNTNIKITSGTVTNVYGGGNQADIDQNTNIVVTGGTISSTIYGGGNEGIVGGNTDVKFSGATANTIYGGGNKAGVTGNTTIEVTGGTISSTIYGGGNEGAIGGNTNITYNNATVGTVFGGGNQAGVTGDTYITVNGGTVSTALYGGGNAGAITGSTNVTVNNLSSTLPNLFGGGNQAGASATNIDLLGSNNYNITNVYGGSNQLGDVTESNIFVDNGTMDVLYGGNNAGGKTLTTNIIFSDGTANTIYGGGNEAESNVTNVLVNGGNVMQVFGGGNHANVLTETNVKIVNFVNYLDYVFGGGKQAGTTTSNVIIDLTTDNTIGNVFGGSNQSGTVTHSNVTVNTGEVSNLYGGNNAGGQTVEAKVIINDGKVHTLFGGGNQAVTYKTDVLVNNGEINVLYGGGNAAGVTLNTLLTMLGGTVNNNLYGGGNEGTVGGNTVVLINNSNIKGSAYAGGNGSTATVFGNTNITVGGTSVIGSSTCTVLSNCSVFGGGNAATTGSEQSNDSVASVNIAGATVYGNVYGGANTSKVYGETETNVGYDAPLVEGINRGNVLIHGTVFGGGEANASGSDTYDWTFISVTKGINVNINGKDYESFNILGSIFGSGNASTASGTSTVTVKNYGTFENPQKNISIQRTNLLVLDNSNIILVGATDRENEYSDVLFSLSRIDELDLTNNSTLFLETGANLLQEFKSLTSDGVLAQVQIDEENGTITKNVDNRIYMFVDKKLNIAKNQNITDYGEVSGMTFFGMYKYNGNGTINTGIYNKYDYGDTLDWGGVFDNVSSYVLGLHKPNHDIEVDGFYSNYIDEATSKNVPNYIEPTPPTGPLYMWTIGEGVIEYEFDMSASKYSTLGTYELSLMDFTDPNTTFQILGFDYSEIEDGISLVEKNNIKKIADTDEEANTIFGLSMETSNVGWLANSNTQFVTDEEDPVVGSDKYIGGNNASAPTILFYLNHSKNISELGSIGKVRIQLMSIRQIDALTKETKRLIITINMSRVLFDTVNYEGALTAGRKYDLFASTATNITSSSSISSYFALFNSGDSIYREGYHRALVSNYVFPLNTKITMIDFNNDNPEYYYHVINQTDVTNATNQINQSTEAVYNLSMFEVMGALNSGVYYDDVAKNNSYYNSTAHYCNEEFIFIIDFGDTNITQDSLNNKILIEMRDDDEETIYSVLAPQHQNMMYNIYTNKDALIDMDGTIDKNKIYTGETLTADLTIDYTQSMVGSTIIYDTHYFDSKLGIKISLINEDGDVVTGSTLLGLYYEIDGVRYDPNIDGTARIKIADKVDSAEKWVIVNTGTSRIASGHYKLRFESFGSPDGIYYGLESSDTKDFDIEIVNEIYGLNVETTPEEMIINKDTGENENHVNEINYTISYNSGLNNPNIHIKMYRRSYNNIDDTNYLLVDFQDYVSTALIKADNDKEYIIVDNPNEETNIKIYLNKNLVSGTYKLEFILYDNSSPIGTVEKYIIIK